MLMGRRPGTAPAKAGLVGVVLALAALILAASCGESTSPPPGDGAAATLATLRMVDDYPLYVMRYCGDYNPEQSLRGEASPRVGDDEKFLCTTFAALNAGGDYLLGRNFDWNNRVALLLCTDPREGYASVSMVDVSYLGFVPGDGSDTNRRKLLRAPHWPFDGMNEKGLAVGMMAVPHAEGGADPRKPTIGSLTAIRLMLDRAATVEEAVGVLAQYNVDFGYGPPVHYLVSDAGRRSAVIEFVDDAMTVIPADTLWQVSTNFVLHGYEWTGSPSECRRYNEAFRRLSAANGLLPPAAAMDLLRDCSQTNTIWSVVYGGGTGEIAVVVGREYGNVHRFTLEQLQGLR
jgi:hypothetical protein